MSITEWISDLIGASPVGTAASLMIKKRDMDYGITHGPHLSPPSPRRSHASATRTMDGDDVGRGEGHCTVRWSTVSYMVSFFRFGGGMGSRPRRVHSRIGGAAVASNVCA
jgi:hypothetical protein